jgi:VanZ family protein
MGMRNLLRSTAPFLPALALMALIFWFSAMPSDDPHKGLLVFLTRKATHFSEYFLLTGLWWWALSGRIGAKRALVPALAIAVAYAMTDEWHQTFVHGRTGTPRDVAIDSAGALTATWLIYRARVRERRPREAATV